MKKNIVMLVVLCVPFVHGMEPENKQWSITAYGTTINLTKAYVCDAYSTIKVGVGIVGYNQQKLLESNSFDYKEQEIGHWYCRGECKIYSYKRSIDDSSKKEIVCKESLLETEIFAFTEPCVFIKDNKAFYYVSRKKPLPAIVAQSAFAQSVCNIVSNEDKKIVGTRSYEDEAGAYIQYQFCGDQAIAQASKDLKKCYKKIFKSTRRPKAGSSIALPALGINIPEAPSIAVASILEYIKKNEDTYGRIELVLEEDADFILYTLSLMKHCGLLKPILMFWFAHHKDSKSTVALLPIELIRSIAQLFYDIKG